MTLRPTLLFLYTGWRAPGQNPACFLPPSLASGLSGLYLSPFIHAWGLISPCLILSPPHFSLLRVVWLGTVLLTHKDGLAVHRGRVLVQGQGVCGQLPGLTALRLRGKDE